MARLSKDGIPKLPSKQQQTLEGEDTEIQDVLGETLALHAVAFVTSEKWGREFVQMQVTRLDEPDEMLVIHTGGQVVVEWAHMINDLIKSGELTLPGQFRVIQRKNYYAIET